MGIFCPQPMLASNEKYKLLAGNEQEQGQFLYNFVDPLIEAYTSGISHGDEPKHGKDLNYQKPTRPRYRMEPKKSRKNGRHTKAEDRRVVPPEVGVLRGGPSSLDTAISTYIGGGRGTFAAAATALAMACGQGQWRPASLTFTAGDEDDCSNPTVFDHPLSAGQDCAKGFLFSFVEIA